MEEEKEFATFEKLKEPLWRIENFIIEHFDEEGHIGGICLEFAKVDKEDPVPGITASLAIGFILGGLFEVTDPEVQADMEAIKKVFREERLLPYLPRERRIS